MNAKGIALSLLVLLPGVALADDPKFDFAKKEDVKLVVWKASAQLGGYGSTGNAQTLTLNGAINLSRNDGWNKVALDVLGAYSTVWNRQDGPTDSNGDGKIDAGELAGVNNRTQKDAAANWLAKLRYDRFFTERNSGYVAAVVGQDYIVNKDVIAAGQVGYSRLILKSEMHELAAEIGYDFTYTHYKPATPPPPTPGTDFTSIHAARLFLGYVLTLRKDTAINASAEAFINITNVDLGTVGDVNTHHGFGGATRVIGKVGVTTVIYKNIGLKFGVAGKFDNAPGEVGV